MNSYSLLTRTPKVSRSTIDGLKRIVLGIAVCSAGASFAQVGNLIWEDNFDSLDLNSWTIDVGDGCDQGLCGWGNQELQWYSENNVSIQDIPGEAGNKALVLEARREGVNGYSFTSGKITTQNKIAVQYGMVEFRIQVPNLESGLWPAAWMLGTSTLSWPAKGEIDIMEQGHSIDARQQWRLYNNDPNDNGAAAPSINTYVGSNLIFYADEACTDGNPTCAASTAWQADNAYVTSTGLDNRFVTYRLYWTDTRMRFAIVDNGVEHDMYESPFEITEVSNEFQQPFYLLLDLAVGGNFTNSATPGDVSAVMPAPMLIDYVRVYELDGKGEIFEGSTTKPEAGTFGVFTDESYTDNKLEAGVTSDIFMWDTNSSEGSIAPFEGDNVIAFDFGNPGNWFGGGVLSRQPRDLSNFTEGNLKFKIKIPADIGFRIGVTDTYTNENWLTFPANETKYGLVRNGEWGEVTIPVNDLRGELIAVQSLQYVFAFSSDSANMPSHAFQYAIDDIIYEGGGPIVDDGDDDSDNNNGNTGGDDNADDGNNGGDDTGSGNSDTAGANYVDASTAQFFVNSNDWADVHYSINGGGLINLRMDLLGNENVLTVYDLNEGDVIKYSFTYWTGEYAVDTEQLTYVHAR